MTATTGVVVRYPTAADFDGWQRLWDGYLNFYDQQLPAEVSAYTWRRLLADDSALIGRVAELDGDVAGFTVSVLHDSTWTTRPILYLEDLFVDPGRRGSGLGRALLDDVVHQARARGCTSLYWHTQTGNANARRLYDRYVAADDFVRYRLTL